jgi:phytoene desaturase
VTSRTDVVVVGAGLGGLACALHLAGRGRQVTVLERADQPGGRCGRQVAGGYQFDTGPTVLTMPELIGQALAAVGEELGDWLTLRRLEPAYRAWFPDGSHLDVIADPSRMAAQLVDRCGRREADGYLRFVARLRELWHAQRADFIERDLDRASALLTPSLVRLVAAGGFGRWQALVDRHFRDPRTRRIFSFQAMYAGLAPHRALASYAVISYLDSVRGVWFPHGGMHAVPQALAGAAEKHGVRFRYGTGVARVEVRGDRARAVVTTAGERIAAGAVVLNPDLAAAHALLPGPPPRRRLRYSPSCVVVHLGARQGFGRIAHHNLHFGAAWRRTFREVIEDGRLMSDPSLLLTNPSRDDPSLAPAGRHTYYLLAPVPNTVAGGASRWRDGLAQRYADELVEVLEARGYRGLGDSVEVRRVTGPAEWESAGLAAGTPFAAAHTFAQTGPFRPAIRHPRLANVVFTGSGTRPGVGVPMVLISGRLAADALTRRP